MHLRAGFAGVGGGIAEFSRAQRHEIPMVVLVAADLFAARYQDFFSIGTGLNRGRKLRRARRTHRRTGSSHCVVISRAAVMRVTAGNDEIASRNPRENSWSLSKEFHYRPECEYWFSLNLLPGYRSPFALQRRWIPGFLHVNATRRLLCSFRFVPLASFRLMARQKGQTRGNDKPVLLSSKMTQHRRAQSPFHPREYRDK